MVRNVTLEVKLFLVVFHAKSLMHNRACGGVLDVDFSIRLDPVFDSKSS